MSIDLCACKRILSDEGLAESRQFGLATELFLGEGKTAFEFITNHVKAHGVEPTLATVKTDTGVDLDVLAPEPLSYYAEKLFDRKVLNITQEHTKSMITHIQGKNAEDAVNEARQIIGETLKWQFGKKTYTDPRLTIDDRIKEQLRLETLHGTIDGYKSPWNELDQITRGMHGGEIWVLIAAKKTGKTWGEILFMRELVKQNLRPLFVTMEMSSEKIIRRFDAMYSTLAFGEFRSGLLGFDGIARYIDEMKKLAQEGEFFIAGDGLVRCPADIEILVQDLNPGVVLIDGVYLMEPSGRSWGSKYEKVSTVVDEIQPMAHRIKRPIMMTTQFNRNLKEGSLTGDSGKVGYAYEIVQNADVVLSMHRDKDLKMSNRMLWSIMEHREGEDFSWLTNWDLDAMNFEFIQEVQLEDLIEDQKKGKASTFKF